MVNKLDSDEIFHSKRSNGKLSKKTQTLYQFGPDSGDFAVSKSYDSVSINTTVDFPFNNEFFSKIYLNKFACISLGGPNLYNGNRSIPIITPFYLNIDLTKGGDIYYGQVVNASRLIKIKEDINLIHPSFNPIWALIVTWYQVTINGVHTNAHNTFQAVLTTSGTNSFIIFNYGKLKVSSNEVFAGYQSEKYDNYYHLNESGKSNEMLNLFKRSNVNKTGKFIFNVDPVYKLSDIFHTFGLAAADSILCKKNQSSNGFITFDISSAFPYHNNYYKTISVNTNGYISFDTSSINLYLSTTTIKTGAIFYREVINPQQLIKTKQDTNLIDTSFNPVWALIITWYELPFYNLHDTRNVFQAVLTTNGSTSFIIFNYGDLRKNNILPNNYEKIHPSKTSNVNKPGKFLFNVNSIELFQNMYPFNPFYGDIVVPKSYDSILINTKVNFPFNNEFYSNIYLNKFACISLGSPMISVDKTVITPFYSNITTTTSGNIFYREETNSIGLVRIKEDINLVDSLFNPTWALIVTWYQVTISNEDANQNNTFQTVLATNGTSLVANKNLAKNSKFYNW